MKRGAHLLIALLVALVACEGPTGPAGPRGPEGEPGPGTRLVFEGRMDPEAGAHVTLPPEAGTIEDPPLVACYAGFGQNDTQWRVIAGGHGSCTLIEEDERLHVRIITAAVYGYGYYRIVVVY